MDYSPVVIRQRPSQSNLKQFRNYTEIKALGKGAFASVLLCHNNAGKNFAVKRLNGRNNKTLQLNEITAGTILNHPNIAKLHESFYHDGHLHLVLEYVDGCDMYDLLEPSNFQPFAPSLVKYLMSQLVAAVAYCHSKGIVHRDIKLENIMVSPKYRIKLVDFGLCHISAGDRLLDTFVGSLDYAAPEILMRELYRGDKVDVFSLGVVFFILTFGQLPFKKSRPQQVKNGQVCEPLFPNPSDVNYQSVNANQLHLIRSMLQNEPNERPTMMQVQKHAYFKTAGFSNFFTQLSLWF
jgi:serine/threonine protein kinase